MISEIYRKYQNIAVTSNRKKRGLFNAVGTINKWFSGTLDANDGERYDKAIRTLEQNQQNIVQEVNKQVSLSKHLINNYANTIGDITKNQKKISDFLDKHEYELTVLKDELHLYVEYSNVIDKLHITANMLMTFLETLENAIMFSNIHVLHPDIVNIQELKEIISELSSQHSEEEILKLNYHAWYKIAKTTCHFSESRIIFALDIPIAYPETFNLYHLYPIPTKNDTLLIPPKPYLALQKKIYQYMQSPCEEIDELHICIQEHMLTNPNQDCISALILGQDGICQPIAVHVPTQIFEKVNEEHVIIITKSPTKMKEWCQGNLKTSIIKGAKLIQVPTNCTIEIQNFKFGNIKTNCKGQPLLLPELNINITMPVKSTVTKIKLKSIKLDEVHALHKQIDSMETITLKDPPEKSSWNWIFGTSILIISLLLLSYGGYKIRRCCKKIPSTRSQNPKHSNQNSTPSVLFNPEAVS